MVKRIASLYVTLLGMGLLMIGAALSYGNPAETSIWVLVIPMAILSLNLLAAIFTNSRINRQMGLLVFHISLLLLVLLAAIGRLTHLDAHLEITQNNRFSPDLLLESKSGPLHNGDIGSVHFMQGAYTVAYDAGLKRGLTHSYVKFLNKEGQWQDKVVGDDRPLVINGYRFYTTHNKGFTAIVSWIPNSGEAETGSINMPSYPLFEYKQDNRWTPKEGSEIKFWLQLKTGLDENAAWVLDGNQARGVLVVNHNGERTELQEGEIVNLDNGRLRYEALTTWMGYRVFYDPTIKWMFFVSIMAVFGLSHYFWVKSNMQVWKDAAEEKTIPSGEMHNQLRDARACQKNTSTLASARRGDIT